MFHNNFSREYMYFDLHNNSGTITNANSEFTTSLTIFLILLSVMITISNLLIIVMVITSQQLHKTTYYLIASLATADMLVGLIITPFFILWLLNHVMLQNPYFCKMVLMNSLFLTSASIVNLMVLTIERYLAICHTLFHKYLVSKENFVKVTITAEWFICVIMTLLSSFLGMKSNLKGKTCNYHKAFNKEFLQGALILGVMLPFISMFVLYVKIFHTIKTHLRQKRDQPNSIPLCENLTQPCTTTATAKQKYKHNHKLTITLALIFTFFVLAWGPFFAVIFTQAFCSTCTIPAIVNDLIVLFGFIHSFSNPIIYSLRHPNFKSLCRQSIRHTYRRVLYLIGLDVNGGLEALAYHESGHIPRSSSDSSN